MTYLLKDTVLLYVFKKKMFSRKICEIGLFAEKKKDKEIVKFSVAEKSGIFTRKIREIGAEKKKKKELLVFTENS